MVTGKAMSQTTRTVEMRPRLSKSARRRQFRLVRVSRQE